jgi:hypothetical protein
LSADHLGALDNAVERFSRLVQNAVSLLKAGDIQLLLCGGKVPSPARHYLREAGIVAVEMVPEDLLGLLAGCCATHPLPNIYELRDSSCVAAAAVSLSLSLLDVDPSTQ